VLVVSSISQPLLRQLKFSNIPLIVLEVPSLIMSYSQVCLSTRLSLFERPLGSKNNV
jgi:hypothetical protein